MVDPADTGKFKNKEDVKDELESLEKRLYELLYLMFAEGKRSLLIVLHGIDTAGKDGVVRHLFSFANPQGLRVYSFKKPSAEELRHDFLWRCHIKAPEAGFATIFNRSYYEEVTTVKVHPELLKNQHLPDEIVNDPNIFKKRYQHINEFECFLTESGTQVVKFLLHISKDEQKKRLEERIKDHTKNWKYSPDDAQERKFWDDYMKVFEEMIKNTSTKEAPWYVIPSDNKWYRNYLITKTLVERLEKLKMKFPRVQERG